MNRYLFYFLLLVGVGLRLALLLSYDLVNGGEVDVYLADEGIVGLMGKHIVEGVSLPIFFYGQHYLGALEAYLAALSFTFFEPSFLSLRGTTVALSLLLPLLVYRFAYRRYSVTAARWATVLVACAPMYFLQWNIKARGGFMEHLVLVMLVMTLFWRFFLEHDRSHRVGLLLGLTLGVALWVNQLMLTYVFLIAALLWFERRDRRGIAALAAGILLGASLLIAYNVANPLATFRTLGRKAVVLNRVPVEERDESWLAKGVAKRVEALTQGADKLGLVFGVPPRAGVVELGLTAEARKDTGLSRVRRFGFLVPAVFFGVALWACRPRKGRLGWERPGSDQLLGLFVLATVVVGYVSPRYMLPVYPIAAVMAGALIARMTGPRRRLLYAGVAAVLAFNTASWVDAMTRAGSGDERRIESLLDELKRLDLTRCYSAGPLYHVVFASGEEVVISPLQKDRYPRYGEIVARTERICYIYRDDQRSKRQHVAFMKLLEDEQVAYETDATESYRILHSFAPRTALTGDAVAAVRKQERVHVTIGGALKALREDGDEPDRED